ncbi:MAG: hypothetical protein WD072_11140 [Pirellulales bacterium]
MILSHENAFSKAKTQLDELVEFAVQAAQTGERIDRVEWELFWRLLAIGLSVLQGCVALQGDGDEGAWIERDDGSLQRLKKKHRRRYLSVFGEISILRWVYARREGRADAPAVGGEDSSISSPADQRREGQQEADGLRGGGVQHRSLQAVSTRCCR